MVCFQFQMDSEFLLPGQVPSFVEQISEIINLIQDNPRIARAVAKEGHSGSPSASGMKVNESHQMKSKVPEPQLPQLSELDLLQHSLMSVLRRRSAPSNVLHNQTSQVGIFALLKLNSVFSYSHQIKLMIQRS